MNDDKVTDKIGNIRLYNGNCFEWMIDVPTKWYDLAIVDPPYQLPKDSSNGRGKLKNRVFNRGNIAERWDKKPPKEYFDEFAGIKTVSKLDFKKRVEVFADGKTAPITLPETNVIKYTLGNDEWVCIRPSGTEPKLKIYVATKAGSSDKANAIAEKYVAFMKAFLS